MKERIIEGTQKHDRLVKEVMAVIGKADVSPPEILAVMSLTVGRLVAMQDQRKYSSAAVMQIVARNIEAGNQQMIDELLNSQGEA